MQVVKQKTTTLGKKCWIKAVNCTYDCVAFKGRSCVILDLLKSIAEDVETFRIVLARVRRR